MTDGILFLQDLDLPRRQVLDLMREMGLPLEPEWRDSGEPDRVAALVTVNAPVDTKLLARFPRLRLVSVAFTGYDHVDLSACRRRGIAVCNVPGYATAATAELTVGLTLALLRRLPHGDRIVRRGGWSEIPPGVELAGKTAGIIGTGDIGLRVARVFAAMDSRVIGWSRTHRAEFTALGGAYVDSLDDLLRRADIVTLHVPLNDSTRGLIGRRELACMKRSAVLINTARGPIVDEAALVEALREHRIAGAALDVFSQEPLPPDHPLLLHDNVVLTPHTGYRTGEALQRRARIALENVRAFFDGRPQNRVG